MFIKTKTRLFAGFVFFCALFLAWRRWGAQHLAQDDVHPVFCVSAVDPLLLLIYTPIHPVIYIFHFLVTPMSNIIQLAAERRQELRSEIANIASEIDRLKKEQESATAELLELDAFFRVAAKLDPTPVSPQEETADTTLHIRRTRAYGAKKEQIVAFARNAIREHGAMPASRILELLDSAGLGTMVGGQDQRGRISNLSATLSRDDRFVSDRNAGGYVYKETAPQDGNQEGLI